MRIYDGRRQDGRCDVMVDGMRLPLRLELRSHSPMGFEWGYAGSGPAQLALAILVDHLRDRRRALLLYQSFKFRLIAGLPRDGWRLTTDDIAAALNGIDGTATGGHDDEM